MLYKPVGNYFENTLKMLKEDKIKYLDLIIENIEDVDLFIPYEILSKKTNLVEPEISNVDRSIRHFATTYELFEKNGSGSFFKLTPRGNELKDFKKGFIKFLKKTTEKPWYNENWVGYVLAAIVFSFTVYQHFEKKNLTNQVFSLEKARDSLMIQEEIHKSSLSDLKAKLEKQKELKK